MRPRRIAGACLALAAMAALAGLAANAVVQQRLARVHILAEVPVAVPDDADARARGRHLVEAIGQCTTCHGEDLSGRPMADDAWLGRLWSSNLTPGRGGVAQRSDSDLMRAIRHGVKPDGRTLVMMPSQYLHGLSDSDLGAIVAHLRRLPPVDRETPPLRVGPLSALALLSGRAPDLLPAEQVAAATPRSDAPEPQESPDYGAYLVEVGGCRVCHRADLRGGLHPLSLPGEPPPPDLTPAGPLAGWSAEDFVRTLRTGATPDGRVLDPEWMPWPATARLSDLELRAVWLFLRSLPAGWAAAPPG